MEYLYRAFDCNNQLLYVGISNDWTRRLHEHEKQSLWFDKTQHVTIEKFETRAEVEVAEKAAIEQEKPVFNKQYSTSFDYPRNHWVALKKAVKSGKADDYWHQDLIDLIRSGAEVYEKKPRQLRPAGIAFLFKEVIGFLEFNREPICRNCQGVLSAKMLQPYVSDGEIQLLKGTTDATH